MAWEDAVGLNLGAASFGGMDFLSTAATNSANAKQAQKNREFQEKMARNAHQFEVEDLRKAGLNPILSGTGGRGAQASGGAQAVMENPRLGSSAMGFIRQREEIKNLKMQNRVMDSQHHKNTAEAQLANQLQNTHRSYMLNTDAHTDLVRLQLPGARTEAAIDEGEYGAALRYLNRILPGASSAVEAARAIRGGGARTIHGPTIHNNIRK